MVSLNGPNKLEFYITLGWKGMPRINTLRTQTVYTSGAVFILLHFQSKLQMDQNKLECYITLGWKGLPGTNTLAYKG
jgi:hypothetical protein